MHRDQTACTFQTWMGKKCHLLSIFIQKRENINSNIRELLENYYYYWRKYLTCLKSKHDSKDNISHRLHMYIWYVELMFKYIFADFEIVWWRTHISNVRIILPIHFSHISHTLHILTMFKHMFVSFHHQYFTISNYVFNDNKIHVWGLEVIKLSEKHT